MNQDEFNNLLDELINLGESKEEMEHWRKLYAFMTEEEKQKLEANLQKTLTTRQA